MAKDYDEIFKALPPEEQAEIKARYEVLRQEYLEKQKKRVPRTRTTRSTITPRPRRESSV